MVAYNPDVSYFTSEGSGTPSGANITNIRIQNSSNSNFLFSHINHVDIADVELYNNYLNDTNARFSIFSMNQADKVIVRNIHAENQCGSVFRMDAVLNQQFYNCSFKNTSTSQDLIKELQNIVYITRRSWRY